MRNKYTFYINIIKYNLKNEFKELSGNMLILFSNFKMFLTFLLLLPITFYVIKIQVLVGVLFLMFYLLLFILFRFFLKSQYTISCKEVPLNTSRIFIYTFFNLLVFLPKAKAFLFVYNFLNSCLNSNNNKLEKMFIITTIIFFSFLIKFYILFIIGYTYLSILTSSNLTINYFNVISWKYESTKAKIQHIFINCFLDNKDSIGKADEMNIIIDGGVVVFNMKSFVQEFLSNVKNPEKLLKAFHCENPNIFSKNFIDNHFNFLISSKAYPDKNLSKNFTSTENVVVYEKNNLKSFNKVACEDKYNPNLKGEDKNNFLTRTYELNKQETIIKEVNKNILIKMQNVSKHVYNSIIDDKEKLILYSENGKFYNKENSPLVKEYSKEFKLSIYYNIKNLSEFEKENEKYLNTEKGKKDYEIFKSLMKNTINFKNNTNDEI